MLPIDEQDASAMQHDKDYDKVGAKGIVGVLSNKTLKADQNFIKRAGEINKKYNNKINDNITGKNVTKGEDRARFFGEYFFKILGTFKPNNKDKNEEKFRDSGPKY